MEIAIAKGRTTRPDIKLGICGEHGGDPDSVKFCHRISLMLRELITIPCPCRPPRRRAESICGEAKSGSADEGDRSVPPKPEDVIANRNEIEKESPQENGGEGGWPASPSVTPVFERRRHAK